MPNNTDMSRERKGSAKINRPTGAKRRRVDPTTDPTPDSGRAQPAEYVEISDDDSTPGIQTSLSIAPPPEPAPTKMPKLRYHRTPSALPPPGGDLTELTEGITRSRLGELMNLRGDLRQLNRHHRIARSAIEQQIQGLGRLRDNLTFQIRYNITVDPFRRELTRLAEFVAAAEDLGPFPLTDISRQLACPEFLENLTDSEDEDDTKIE